MKVYALKIRQVNDWGYPEDLTDATEVGRIFASHAVAKKYCEELTRYGALFGTTQYGGIVNWCLVKIEDDDTYIYRRPINDPMEEDLDPYEMTIQIVARDLVTDENPLYKIEVVKESENEAG